MQVGDTTRRGFSRAIVQNGNREAAGQAARRKKRQEDFEMRLEIAAPLLPALAQEYDAGIAALRALEYADALIDAAREDDDG